MADTPLDSSQQGIRKAYLPESAPPTNHGHTTAAWVTVSLIMVGAVLASVAVIVSQPWLFWVGLGVVVVAVVVGLVLKVLGLGQPTPPRRGSAETGSDVDSSKEQA